MRSQSKKHENGSQRGKTLLTKCLGFFTQSKIVPSRKKLAMCDCNGGKKRKVLMDVIAPSILAFEVFFISSLLNVSRRFDRQSSLPCTLL